jgi:hypothetical protein
MSTDILKFPTSNSTGKPEKVFAPEALRYFLALTLPTMFLTFLAWAGFNWWVNRRER